MVVHKSLCQLCFNCCPIEVEVEAGRAVRISGNKSNQHFGGYSCGKGRRQLAHHYSPDRILQPRKRLPDGSLTPVPSSRAMDEIATHVGRLVAEHGPRSVAVYLGTQAFQIAGASVPVIKGFMTALGSSMVFDSSTIDQPGKLTARALHGSWMAPRHTPHEADALLLFGANPLVSMLGLPSGNQGRWLTRKLDDGAELIVVDPRRTETARRATLFLQPRPGHDVAILATVLKVVLAEGLGDPEFLGMNTTGVEALRRAVAPFSPEAVARHAGVDADDLVRAARIYGRSPTGYAHAGTGPNMAQFGTLVEYLILALTTVCGHRHRAGDVVPDPLSLYPALPALAQAVPPSPANGFGEALRVRGLTTSAAGLPTSALADEILLDGPGRVRALFSVGGNPVAAWPDQIRTVAAMQSLELLVQVDPFLSQTAQHADYVIPPRMALEIPRVTQVLDLLQGAFGMGHAVPYAQYSPPVLDAPEGSDLLSEWKFFYGLAQRLGLTIEVPHPFGTVDPIPLDMSIPPTDEDILDIVCTGSRLPLDLVRAHPDGMEGETAAEPRITVGQGDPSSEARLQVGDVDMMSALGVLAGALDDPPGEQMSLISRRETHVVNSAYNAMAARGGRRHNPLYLNPSDMHRLGVEPGDQVRIASARAAVSAIVASDDSIRPGVAAMSHAFGGALTEQNDPREFGSSTARLCDVEDDYDPYSGQPRMSGIAVVVTPLERAPASGMTDLGHGAPAVR